MNDIIDGSIIYPNLEAAAAAVCSKWCQQQGYTDRFYSDGSWWAFPLSESNKRFKKKENPQINTDEHR